METFIDAVKGGERSPIPFDELVNVTLASFAVATAANERRSVMLHEE